MNRTLPLVAGLLLAGMSQAQLPAAARSDAGFAAPTRIELKDFPGRPGEKAALYQGTADAQGQFFQSSGNWVLTPIAVTVTTQDKSQTVVLKLFKENLETPEQEISSRGKGYARARFRTQGDYTLQVLASKATPYQLLVSTGKEMKADLPPPFEASLKKGAKP